MRYPANKSQAAMYGIIAIVILVSSLSVVLISYNKNNLGVDSRLAQPSVEPVKNFIESCLEIWSAEAIGLAGEQAGYIMSFPQYLTYLETEKSTFYVLYDNGLLLLPSSVALERNISEYISTRIDECVSPLESRMGVKITSHGSPVVTTALEENDVLIYLRYPIIISDGGATVEIDEFYTLRKVKLGKIRSAAEEILLVIQGYEAQLAAGETPDPSMLAARYEEIKGRYEAEQIFIYAYTPRYSKVTLWLITDKSGEEPFNFLFATKIV